MKNLTGLDKLPVGMTGKIKYMTESSNNRRRLLDLGLTQNSIIRNERLSPSGNPIAYNIRGAIMALRVEDTKNIIIELIN
ncbi:FeoA family protein [Anaeromonas gelatinilytica]|uniref:FeoA family protein n=1 Tax=Anaeromonas gelatinilytica TaxID=2683194 RepID=UPI002078E8D3|nr:FeoA family protein [Anaeromonas gelatinilytica]